MLAFGDASLLTHDVVLSPSRPCPLPADDGCALQRIMPSAPAHCPACTTVSLVLVSGCFPPVVPVQLEMGCQMRCRKPGPGPRDFTIQRLEKDVHLWEECDPTSQPTILVLYSTVQYDGLWGGGPE